MSSSNLSSDVEKAHPMHKGAYTASTKRLQRLFAVWVRQKAITNKLAFVLVGLAVFFGVLTYAALTSAPPFGNDPDAIIWLLNIDLLIIVSLLFMIIRRITVLWSSRKKGVAGARLHVRLVYTFMLLAGLPAVIMTVFSAFFFYYSVHGWFSQNVERAINESLAVAEAYLDEHALTIKADTVAMSNDLDRQAVLLSGNQEAMEKMMRTQSFFRNLTEALLINKNRDILAQSEFGLSIAFENVTDDLLEQADQNIGEAVIIRRGDTGDRIRALVKLTNYEDTYLFAGRFIDPKVLTHLEATRKGVREYNALRGSSVQIQVTVTMIYVVIAILFMMAAIWFALNLARRIVEPIGQMINATQAVSAGDLTARVHVIRTRDEFETLANAFNTMTEKLQIQQSELVGANRMLDYRRRFNESILAGVSTGVINISDDQTINLVNKAGLDLLGEDFEVIKGKHIATVMPEAYAAIDELFCKKEKTEQILSHDIDFRRPDGTKRHFRIKASLELFADEGYSVILTFDDITDIQIAQRRTAWSDVARRIAHEIKNPLTPIQLSTERLRRKYMKTLETDKEREIFEQCTDTIIKHVGDIKNMVNAFSDFAKMPEPKIANADFSKLIKQIFSLQKQANAHIRFKDHIEDDLRDGFKLECDEQQIRQSLTNLMQNAVDSLDEYLAQQEMQDFEAKIGLIMHRDVERQRVIIGVADNGPGIAPELMDRVSEPYVTNKKKGTGLGLAIVKKIAEDHGGILSFDVKDLSLDEVNPVILDSAPYTGAQVFFTIPLHSDIN